MKTRMMAVAAAAAAALKKAQDTRDTLTGFGKGLVVEVQVGADGEVTDSLTAEDVANLIKLRCKVTLDPSMITLPEVISLGSMSAEVVLHPDVIAPLKILVEKSKITFT